MIRPGTEATAAPAPRNVLPGGVPATEPPPPGEMPVVMAALSIGLLLMGVQLWLLTVALELYLEGHGDGAWHMALVSGAIFAGGLLVLRMLPRRTPRRMSHLVPDASSTVTDDSMSDYTSPRPESGGKRSAGSTNRADDFTPAGSTGSLANRR